MTEVRIGVDTGGTFTDVIAVDDEGRACLKKVPSTPADFSQCFIAGVEAVLREYPVSQPRPAVLLHGATVATNALLEKRFPVIGLIVTEGFREILEIARQTVPGDWGSLYVWVKPPRIVPLELVQEVRERVDAKGTVLVDLDEEEVYALARWYRARGVSAIAVSLLHSYVNPAHERRIREILAAEYDEMSVVLSSDVLPEFREYERTVTTCINTALMPVVGRYLEKLIKRGEERGFQAPLLVMKSSGGVVRAQAAVRKPIYTVLSGPSAAVLGMSWLGAHAGFPNLITLDMGGTSTDVSLVKEGQPLLTTEGQIEVYPVRTPMVDIVTIGAGGGSMAWLGVGGRLQVGPRSAGAEPGPVCYGRGGKEVTVTDAHLTLGRLPSYLLGGAIPLDREAAEKAIEKFGQKIGLNPVEAASGILQITNYNMCGAIRQVSVRRGYDPRDYALLAMGGAGPLHAADLADLLGIPTIVIPPAPGLSAAYGLLVADIKDDFVQTLIQRESALDSKRVAQMVASLEKQAWETLTREEVPEGQRLLFRAADLRYVGMATELTVEMPGGAVTQDTLQRVMADFHRAYHQAYGYSYEGQQEVELINLRVTAIGLLPKPRLPEVPAAMGGVTPKGRRQVFFSDRTGFVDCPVYERERLGAGATLTGPAIVEQYDSTGVVPPDFWAQVDRFGNLILERG